MLAIGLGTDLHTKGMCVKLRLQTGLGIERERDACMYTHVNVIIYIYIVYHIYIDIYTLQCIQSMHVWS